MPTYSNEEEITGLTSPTREGLQASLLHLEIRSQVYLLKLGLCLQAKLFLLGLRL
jgi:hypothetical protein